MSSNPFISSGGAFTNLNQLQIHCSPYEWWVSLRSGYTHSRGKYDIENFTKSLYLRRLVQRNSCFLAGFLTFMIRDVFILLELLTCAWKCEFPQAPVSSWPFKYLMNQHYPCFHSVAVCSLWWMMTICVKLHILVISRIEGVPSILENWSTKLPDRRPMLFLYDAVFQNWGHALNSGNLASQPPRPKKSAFLRG